MEGCSWCGMLVLVDPMVEGVAEVNGESVGGTENECRFIY